MYDVHLSSERRFLPGVFTGKGSDPAAAKSPGLWGAEDDNFPDIDTCLRALPCFSVSDEAADEHARPRGEQLSGSDFSALVGGAMDAMATAPHSWVSSAYFPHGEKSRSRFW